MSWCVCCGGGPKLGNDGLEVAGVESPHQALQCKLVILSQISRRYHFYITVQQHVLTLAGTRIPKYPCSECAVIHGDITYL